MLPRPVTDAHRLIDLPSGWQTNRRVCTLNANAENLAVRCEGIALRDARRTIEKLFTVYLSEGHCRSESVHVHRVCTVWTTM